MRKLNRFAAAVLIAVCLAVTGAVLNAETKPVTVSGITLVTPTADMFDRFLDRFHPWWLGVYYLGWAAVNEFLEYMDHAAICEELLFMYLDSGGDEGLRTTISIYGCPAYYLQ